MMAALPVTTPHALILTVSHGLFFRQPLICGGTNVAGLRPKIALPSDSRIISHLSARVRLNAVHVGADRDVEPSLTVTDPQQHGPHQRPCRGVEYPSSCATFSDARRTD
jgi:hypothetical protein